MKLRSNISVVIKRLEELQAGYPLAVRKALAPEWWTPQLKTVAQKTLEAQVWSIGVTDEQDVQTRARFKRMIPAMVESVMGVAAPPGVLFKMFLPPGAVTDISFHAAARFAGDQWTPTGRAKKWAMPDPQGEENLTAARAAVLDWVMLEKQRDERDTNKDGSPMSDEQIAQRVETILGLRPAMGGRTTEMDDAAEKLRGAIEAWLSGADATPSGEHRIESPPVDRPRGRIGISEAQAAQWLGAVLAAWVAFVRVRLRDRIEGELKKLHAKVKTKQPELI